MKDAQCWGLMQDSSRSRRCRCSQAPICNERWPYDIWLICCILYLEIAFISAGGWFPCSNNFVSTNFKNFGVAPRPVSSYFLLWGQQRIERIEHTILSERPVSRYILFPGFIRTTYENYPLFERTAGQSDQRKDKDISTYSSVVPHRRAERYEIH